MATCSNHNAEDSGSPSELCQCNAMEDGQLAIRCWYARGSAEANLADPASRMDRVAVRALFPGAQESRCDVYRAMSLAVGR